MILPMADHLALAVTNSGVCELYNPSGGGYHGCIEVNEIGVIGGRTGTANTMGVVTAGAW